MENISHNKLSLIKQEILDLTKKIINYIPNRSKHLRVKTTSNDITSLWLTDNDNSYNLVLAIQPSILMPIQYNIAK